MLRGVSPNTGVWDMVKRCDPNVFEEMLDHLGHGFVWDLAQMVLLALQSPVLVFSAMSPKWWCQQSAVCGPDDDDSRDVPKWSLRRDPSSAG